MRERDRERERVQEKKKRERSFVALLLVGAIPISSRLWLTFLLAGARALAPSSMSVTMAMSLRVRGVRRRGRRRRRSGGGGGRSGRRGDVALGALARRKRESNRSSSGGDSSRGRRRAALGTAAAGVCRPGRRGADESVLHGEKKKGDGAKKGKSFSLSSFSVSRPSSSMKKSTLRERKETQPRLLLKLAM